MARNNPDPPQAVPPGGKAIETIKAMRDGKLSVELDVSFADVIAAVMATGKKGKVTLDIIFEPVPKGEPHMIFASDAVKVTIPKLSKSATMFYANEECALTRRDPRQPALEMEAGPVTRPAKPLAAVVSHDRPSPGLVQSGTADDD
jgi:hypothetical protein